MPRSRVYKYLYYWSNFRFTGQLNTAALPFKYTSTFYYKGIYRFTGQYENTAALLLSKYMDRHDCNHFTTSFRRDYNSPKLIVKR